MRIGTLAAFTAGSLMVVLIGAAARPTTIPPAAPRAFADATPQDPQGDMQAMMAKAAKWTQPGPMHKHLERFLGKWKTESRFVMGPQKSPPEIGTFEFRWLMDGRWLIGEGNGKLMGKPFQTAALMGYDNFKQSFVVTLVGSMDTMMLRSEGDLTPDGKALITYGTLDEYLTGEHDKMVKYVWRFVSDNEIVQEVHDLPIGETGTQVLEMRYTKQ